MSAIKKPHNINTHVIDIFGSVKGRDQPVMKMDKAVDLSNCLNNAVLSSDDYVFFDPFCKAGEILLATALLSFFYRTNKKLASSIKKSEIPQYLFRNRSSLLKQAFKHLYKSNRFFALAPDQRHYRLSLRTFFGNDSSHDYRKIKDFKNGNYLSEIDGRLDTNKFQKELNAMIEFIKEKVGNKKIIAIGNPPYQEEDGGYGSSAKPIYNFFVESLIDSGVISALCVVIPSRWFTSGKNLTEFRERIISCEKIKSIKYFENSKEVFPTVEISGGIAF